jgi:hypothetical protein
VEGENNIKLRKADSCGFVFMRGRILSKALLTLKKKKKNSGMKEYDDRGLNRHETFETFKFRDVNCNVSLLAGKCKK